MGRKRNQGKARRAARAAKAMDEAERREEYNNNQAANSSEQSEGRQVQIGEEILCRHGFETLASDQGFVRAFDSSFIGAFTSGDYSFRGCLIVAKNDTMDEFAAVWNDSTKMEMMISCFLFAGTQFILEGNDDAARDAATYVRFFEQCISVMFKQTLAQPNWPKIEETYYSDDHTLVKFYRHRIPCSCLDEKYEEVKHITKKGFCYNNECKSFLGSEGVERSKTMCCSRCRNEVYCSCECQVADWLRHKPECDQNAARKAAFDAKQQNM